MNFKRVFLLELDSLGVEKSEADINIVDDIIKNHDLFIPNLKKIGFLNTLNLKEDKDIDAYYTFSKQKNAGKDTINSHYEMMGIPSNIPFKTFNEGFPNSLLSGIGEVTGRKIIGNVCSLDDSILNELGEHQINYGALIVYTKADSDIEIAAHEDSIPVGLLYEYCKKIRAITIREEWRVARVVARPFNGTKGNFKFNNNARRDYAIKPPKRSVLDSLNEAKYNVIGIGKVNSIFDGVGINKQINSSSNKETINKLTDIMDKSFTGLCIADLSEFESESGKKDVDSVVKGIEELDVEIPIMLNKLTVDDLLIITFDLGKDVVEGVNDDKGNVQVILYSRNFKEPKVLTPFETLADIGATIADNFDVELPSIGNSILNKLK